MDAELSKSKKILKEKAWTRWSELGAAAGAALLRVLVGTACLGGYMKLNEFYPISRISEVDFIAENGPAYRMFYCFMVS